MISTMNNREVEDEWTVASRRKRRSLAPSPTSVTDSTKVAMTEQKEENFFGTASDKAAAGAAATATPEKKKKKKNRKKKKPQREQVNIAIDTSLQQRTDATTTEEDSLSSHDLSSPLTQHHEEIQSPEKKSVAEENEVNSKIDYATAPTPPFSRLLKLFQPEWIVCYFTVLLMLVTEVTSVVNPSLIASSYESLTDPDPDLTRDDRMSNVNGTIQKILIIHVAGNICAWLRFSIVGVVSERVVTRLRVGLYRNLLRQEIGFFDVHNSGTLANHLASDTTLVQEAMSQALPEAIVGVVKLLAISGAMLYISTHLALVTVGCVGLSIGLSSVFGRWMGQWTKKYFDLYGGALARCYEALASMRMVQAFVAEEKEDKHFCECMGEPNTWFPRRSGGGKIETTYNLGITKSLVNASFYTFIFFSGFGSIYVSMWYGFSIVIDEELTFGQLAAFQALMVQVAITVVTLSRFVTQLLNAQSASARIFFLLDRVPMIPTPPPTAPKEKSSSVYVPPTTLLKPKSMKGAIEFRNVHFSYPTRPGVRVLKGLSLSIPSNTTCALVGPSGAGKSTVVSLLQRFFDVESGSVRVDGKDIRDLDLKWLRSHMGYVQQEPVLFAISIRDNICYGVDREVDQEELEAVCRKANAHNFISAFPCGYDTMVGERGIQLSGGQKQRLAIARALLVNPRILLLDEATSALDAESEHLVQEAIDNAVAGRTVVVIAHRLSTIKHANQIVLIDNHKIYDVGTHEELLQRCSKYQQLIRRQHRKHD